MTREDIVNKIIEEQEKHIENLENTVNQYKTASDLDESEPRDTEDLSHQDEAKDMQLRYENMLAEAENNLQSLKSGAGTLIETDKAYFFSGIAVPPFKLGDKDIISFSSDAPISAKLEGVKTGDKVKIGELEHEILSVK